MYFRMVFPAANGSMRVLPRNVTIGGYLIPESVISLFYDFHLRQIKREQNHSIRSFHLLYAHYNLLFEF